MKNNIKESIVTILLIILAILLLNPFNFWMPDMMLMPILIITLMVLAIFSTLILREKSFDERDVTHKTLAGRNAFLAGSVIVMIGIIFESLSHNVDPWLVISLVVMIVAKITTRIWSDRNL